jgi:hypothetical protein
MRSNNRWRSFVLVANSVVLIPSLSSVTLQLVTPHIACAQVTLDLASLPACSPASSWRLARDETLDLTGKDLLGHHIGLAHAGDKWYPYSEVKQTVCGELHEFKYYHDIDHDWAFNLIPYGRFQDMLDVATAAGGKPICKGKCVHAEVNMDQSFPRNDFFRIVNFAEDHLEETDLLGTNMCVYGPWLKDVGHDDKPEIHPAELVWWRHQPEDPPPLWRLVRQWGVQITSYHVMLLQDDRNSFDRNSDFSEECFWTTRVIRMGGHDLTIPWLVCPPLPSSFRPWAKVPRLSELRIAFEADASGAKQTSFSISERYSRNVITGTDELGKRDQGPGTDYGIIFKGVPVLTVKEKQPDDHLGVLFDDLCFNAEDNHVRGYIVVNSKYGVDDRGEEGYLVLDIIRGELDLKKKALLERLREAGTTAGRITDSALDEIIETFRHAIPPKTPPGFDLGGPPRRAGGALVGDIVLGPEYDGTTPVLPRQARLEVGNRSVDLRIEKNKVPMPGSTIIRAVPVANGGVVRLKLADGKTYRVDVPTLGIETAARIDSAVSPQPAPDGRRAFAAALGLTGKSHPVPGSLMRSSRWVLEMVPVYGPRVEGEVSLEDETPFTRSLNATIDSAERVPGDSILAKLFGTSQPFAVSWRFTASDALTGDTVPVVIASGSSASSRGIVVDTAGHVSPRLGFRVAFPDSSRNLYLLHAVASVKDPFSQTGETEYTVWSHYLKPASDSTGSELLSAVARFAGQDPARILELSRASTELEYKAQPGTARLQTYARQARISAVRSASDGRVTLSELRGLLHIVQEFESNSHRQR